jgi:hypothetical protein
MVEALHPNVARIRVGFEVRQRLRLNAEDRVLLDDLLSEDVVWHGGGKGKWARDYIGKPAVFALFDEVSKRTGGTLEIWPNAIYADDVHAVIIAGLKADFGDRQHEWTEAQISHMTPEGKIREFSGIPDEQDVVDAFFFPPAAS